MSPIVANIRKFLHSISSVIVIKLVVLLKFIDTLGKSKKKDNVDLIKVLINMLLTKLNTWPSNNLFIHA